MSRRSNRFSLRALTLTALSAALLFPAAHARQTDQSCKPGGAQTPVYWNIDRLSAVKTQVTSGDEAYSATIDKLRRDADALLDAPAFTVTNKTRPGPSGDLKDYVSLSRYFWPNPKTEDGLPYIRKDGHSNPEINGIDFDRRRSQQMTDAVKTLSLAAYFTGDQAYADKARSLVQVWFIDEATAMNPSLNYAQHIPGINNGREFGILDTRIYWDVIDSMLLLHSAGMGDDATVAGLQVWFNDYAKWLIRSDFGKKASRRSNNHGTFYDAQLSHILMFIGECEIAGKVVARGHERTQTQIETSGLQPEEKERSRSLFYHAFNLEAFLRLSRYAQNLDAGFYDTPKRRAGSVRDSVDFIASYAGRIEDWPYQEITPDPDKAILDMLYFASLVDDRASVRAQIKAMEDPASTDPERLIFALPAKAAQP